MCVCVCVCVSADVHMMCVNLWVCIIISVCVSLLSTLSKKPKKTLIFVSESIIIAKVYQFVVLSKVKYAI